MSNSSIHPYLRTHFVAGLLAATAWALPAGAQYVSTVVTNLSQPAGVATDSSYNVYITDPGNARIAKYVPSSGALSTLAGSSAGIYWPQGIVAARGGLVVADELSQLILYVSFNGTVSTVAGQAFVTGNANLQGTAATFSYPVGIAADSAGNLYVADSQNNAIRKIDTGNNVTTVFAGGYQFNAPSAVAVDNNSNLWVADTGNQVICLISNGTATVMAGISGQTGTNDSLTATDARFNYPSGLLWVGANNSLLIGDTGNNTLRSLFMTNSTYAVQTIAGVPGEAGFVNGAPAIAQFSGPTGLCADVADSGFYITDSGNNALRVFQPSAPQPPVSAPVLGYVNFVPGPGGTPVSQFSASSSAVFNNTAIIAIESETGTQTFITYGPTPANLLSNTIPAPGAGTGSTPDIYAGDNLPASLTEPSIVPTMPDVTIYAVSTAPGRQPSPVVSARYEFITANPSLSGNDAADITVSDQTVNAQMYYTLDGSAPTNDGSNGIGPIASGATLDITLVSNITLNVRAFAPNFAPSGVSGEQLTLANDVGNQMTFGFSSGEASSQFVGAAGQRFFAPVTLTMLPGGTTYSLQFDATVTSGTGPLPPSNYFNGRFDSMLKVGPPPLLETINPGIVTNVGTNYTVSTGVLTNQSENLLEVAWIEIFPQENLYPTINQDLTEYSQAHDVPFLEPAGKVEVGAYSFVIPSNAPANSTYTIQVFRPSATTFDPPQTTPLGVFVQAPTNGSTTTGAINSIKTVIVGTVPYLVGDAYPFRWLNAGDFGDSNLLNDDVIEVFQSAVYQVHTPPAGSDYFDAMDSSNGTTNNIYSGNDTTMDTITNGDGQLKVDDVYVTLRRSLDPDRAWYERYWSNGVRYVVGVPNGGGGPVSPPTPAPAKPSLTQSRFVTVAADQVQAGGNLTVQVPVRVLAADALYPIRVAMLNVEIDPLDGSPAITNVIGFSAVTNLGSPYLTASQASNNFAGAWLDSTVAGVSGTNVIGTLTVTLPPSVTANSAYLVHFDHFSASPNGLALFNATVQDGLITVGNRTGSSWHDGIPDAWRLLYFGTVSNVLSAANADPDGDGASNWQEYIAGTNPLDGTSVFKFAPSVLSAGSNFTLQWPSVVNRLYTVQSSSSLGGGWTTVVSNLAGNSQTLQWTDTNAAGAARFYRALVQ